MATVSFLSSTASELASTATPRTFGSVTTNVYPKVTPAMGIVTAIITSVEGNVLTKRVFGYAMVPALL